MTVKPPRRGRKLLLAGLSLPLFFGLASLDWRPAADEVPPRIVSAASRTGILLAGAGKAEIRLPADATLAGYRPFGRMARDAGRPVYVRSLLLEVGGLRTAIVSAELMTLPSSLAAGITERLRAEGAGCGIVAATHTHSGPGGYDREALPQAVGVGRYDDEVERAILDAASASLAAARAELAPAELRIGEDLAGLGSNRDRPESPSDDRLTVVRLDRPAGGRIAEVGRYSAHPTLLSRFVGPSGDWPGAFMSRVEEEGGVAILLQGAAGDARAAVGRTPPIDADDPIERFAAGLATRLGDVPLLEVHAPVALGCAEAEVALPAPDLGSMVPWPLGRVVSNAASLVAPTRAPITALRLDDLVLLAVPGEPTFGAALAGESGVSASGLRGRTVSLAGAYVGYAPLPADVDDRVFSSRYAWFGPGLAGRLARGQSAAAEALLARPDPEDLQNDRPDDPRTPGGSPEQPGR
ncbi:neutral/alkaline non-lysosomal ceramidase N-terminal domain-containing protein [Vulgatibacter incomptus]|uniref:Neutral/alkaline non-lysosomal ceramidase N-terminal domain-containing protein n=1 Tax=Vulgatibacter incomptus TaxID=1391653 RepID=A0A0K1P8A4_9BACT|nr:neutral/alkaline non-lysosomal ceramidase N-terminal domain-containing protein [Vulgatibacter incomptus]AKU89666.1 hypothetical protein AKJ08_0053 [Vulgatibacter incomptus]